MPVKCVMYEIIGCPMCKKVKEELLEPYQRRGIISVTTWNIGIHKTLPSGISKEMYDYRFLSDETRRTVTPAISIEGTEGKVFLQAMSFNTLVRIFEEELRRSMGGGI